MSILHQLVFDSIDEEIKDLEMWLYHGQPKESKPVEVRIREIFHKDDKYKMEK